MRRHHGKEVRKAVIDVESKPVENGQEAVNSNYMQKHGESK